MFGREKSYFGGVLMGLGVGVWVGMVLSEDHGWTLNSMVNIACIACIVLGSWLGRKESHSPADSHQPKS